MGTCCDFFTLTLLAAAVHKDSFPFSCCGNSNNLPVRVLCTSLERAWAARAAVLAGAGGGVRAAEGAVLLPGTG